MPSPSPSIDPSAAGGVADRPAVVFEGVEVRYGTHTAVASVDLTFVRGQVVSIIGPNGSGKSTLLGTISGLVRPSRGRVEVLGRPPRAVRRQVAHVLQTTVANEAVPLTVRETVRMGCYGRRGPLRPLTAEDRAAVADAVERLRIGDLLDRQLLQLSGGQRQRVYVAQALAQRGDVLLLDEPITGLDMVTQETISEVIGTERARGATVVLTTHDVGTAQLADLTVLMATKVVASGPPAEVLTPEHLAAAYGGHVHVLDDGTVVLDESHHHDHRHHDQL
ncbi:MAG TPA: metal ABC transporter ATP-binding protein [Egicoccus sp.]|nr:metal ABC transporter ATP-binding protein [Egicoccus sp.]HSK23660.1 metal ABC transporter ATP-binding protein [Egicoccus sp.]